MPQRPLPVSGIVHRLVPGEESQHGLDSIQFHTISNADTKLGFEQKSGSPFAHTLENGEEIRQSLFEQERAAQAESEQEQRSEHQKSWNFNDYRGADGRKITVHLCSSSLASDRVARLFSQDSLLGLDLEWKPGAPKGHPDNVCLVQVANAERVALFHVAMSDCKLTSERIPPTLRAILEDRQVRKVGVGIRGDATRLKNILNIHVKGLFELSHLYRLLEHRSEDRIPISKRLVSLTDQAKKHFGLPLPKGSVRTSEWHKPLTHEQISYSANDAYASLILFHTMNQKRQALKPTPPLPRPVEDDYPIQTSSDHTSHTNTSDSDECSAVSIPSLNGYDTSTARNTLIEDIEDSVSLIVDDGPSAPMSRGTMLNLASLASSFAANNWREVSENSGAIKKHHLQVYYLAQVHGRSFNDVALILQVDDVDGIPRSLFSLSKATSLRLSQSLYNQARLAFCLSDRLDCLSQESIRLLVPNERDRISAQEWAHKFPENDRQCLEAYYLWHHQERSLELVAITLERNYRLVADMIFFCFSSLGYDVNLSSERDKEKVLDILEFSNNQKAKSFWQDHIEPEVQTRPNAMHSRSWANTVTDPFPRHVLAFENGDADAVRRTRSALDKQVNQESFITILATEPLRSVSNLSKDYLLLTIRDVQ